MYGGGGGSAVSGGGEAGFADRNRGAGDTCLGEYFIAGLNVGGGGVIVVKDFEVSIISGMVRRTLLEFVCDMLEDNDMISQVLDSNSKGWAKFRSSEK